MKSIPKTKANKRYNPEVHKRYHEKHRERRNREARERRATNRDKSRAEARIHSKNTYARYGPRTPTHNDKARWILNNAIKLGHVQRKACEREYEGTCDGRLEAHHEDYSQ